MKRIDLSEAWFRSIIVFIWGFSIGILFTRGVDIFG